MGPLMRFVSMFPCAAVLLVAGTGLAQAQNKGIEFGETRTRFEVQRHLDAQTDLRPWDSQWQRTFAWQYGNARPRPFFAPPGCFITRRVRTHDGVALKTIYICR